MTALPFYCCTIHGYRKGGGRCKGPYAEIRRTRKPFEASALNVNANSAFKDEPVTWKAIQDRYKRQQDQYGRLEDGNQRLSGFGGGEMSELADLLMKMREARDDWESQKKAVKTAERRKEENKQRTREAFVSAATNRRASSSSHEDADMRGSPDPDTGAVPAVEDVEIVDVEQQGSAKKNRRQKQKLYAVEVSEIDRFGVHLKEADLAHIELERERLSFEQENSVADRLEWEREREERREELKEEREERL